MRRVGIGSWVVVQADDDVGRSMGAIGHNGTKQHNDLNSTRRVISGRSWPTPVYGGKITKTSRNLLVIATANTRK